MFPYDVILMGIISSLATITAFLTLIGVVGWLLYRKSKI